MRLVRQRAWTVLLAVGSVACSSMDDQGPAKSQTYLGLETPADGFQLRNEGEVIPAGEDAEFCEVGTLPDVASGGDLFMSRLELANGDSSHHLILSVAEPGSPAAAALEALPVGHRVPCVSPEMMFGEGLQGLALIQRPYGNFEFPEGIARRLHSGQRVLWDYHYFNTTEEPIRARSAANIHLKDRAEVKQLLGGVHALNWLIDIPPGSTKSFKAECRFDQDMMIGGIVRHTHRWGQAFKTWFAGGDRDGEHIWTSNDFEAEIDFRFDAPVRVKKGEGLAFECTFLNDQQRRLRFGSSASDEMCSFHAPAWDPDGGFEPIRQTCHVVWADETGLGHTADSEGAFPQPPAEDVAACKAGTKEPTECAACICELCTPATFQCFGDDNCAAIVQCAPPADCQAVIDEHSSGVGFARQLDECVKARCPSECNR